jgi:hypothetical protein
MRFWELSRKVLLGVYAVSIFTSASLQACCTEEFSGRNFTSLEEYIQESNKQAEAAGYKTNNYPGINGSAILGTQGSGSPSGGASSGKTAKSCDHNYVESEVIDPTCADPGVRESKCSKCGKVYKTEIPATGEHSYKSEVARKATCIEEGVMVNTCEVCGCSYEEAVPLTEHDYDSLVAEDASCTQDGLRAYICTVCGDSYTEVTPASGHGARVKTVEKESGFFTEGMEVTRCSDCNEVLETVIIPSKASSGMAGISSFFRNLFS